jgi:hypothetical protein
LEYFYPAYAANVWNWGNYYGFYDFILNELFPKQKKDFKLFNEFLTHFQEIHYFWMFEGIAFVSDFPKEIHTNSTHQLHSADKAALLYRDTYSMFRSNGITMNPEYILTPKNKITKEMFLKETNADMRREVIRKIGMDKTIEILEPKVIDEFKTPTGGRYRLLGIKYDDRGERPYLQMQCPSTKNNHILGVGREVKTAKEAWCYLNNEKEFSQPIWEA